jgi:hypothetical protein
VKFQVLTVASLEMTVFWDVAPCSLIEIDRRFGRAYCLHHEDDDSAGDGGSKHIWSVGQFLRDNTAQHPRRRSSSEDRYVCHAFYIFPRKWIKVYTLF